MNGIAKPDEELILLDDDGFGVIVPVGAVSEETPIEAKFLQAKTLPELPTHVGDGAQMDRPLRVTPHGLTLAKPATLKLPCRQPNAEQESRLFRLDNDEDSDFDDLGVLSCEDGVATYETMRFSIFVTVIVPLAPCEGLAEIPNTVYGPDGVHSVGIHVIQGSPTNIYASGNLTFTNGQNPTPFFFRIDKATGVVHGPFYPQQEMGLPRGNAFFLDAIVDGQPFFRVSRWGSADIGPTLGVVRMGSNGEKVEEITSVYEEDRWSLVPSALHFVEGGQVIVWSDMDTTGDNVDPHAIRAQFIANDGTLGPQVEIASSEGGASEAPVLSVFSLSSVEGRTAILYHRAFNARALAGSPDAFDQAEQLHAAATNHLVILSADYTQVDARFDLQSHEDLARFYSGIARQNYDGAPKPNSPYFLSVQRRAFSDNVSNREPQLEEFLLDNESMNVTGSLEGMCSGDDCTSSILTFVEDSGSLYSVMEDLSEDGPEGATLTVRVSSVDDPDAYEEFPLEGPYNYGVDPKPAANLVARDCVAYSRLVGEDAYEIVWRRLR